MSNDRYSAGALIQRLHGLMSCAGLEQRFNFFFFFFGVVARGGWRLGWLGDACGFLQDWVAVACPEACLVWEGNTGMAFARLKPALQRLPPPPRSRGG